MELLKPVFLRFHVLQADFPVSDKVLDLPPQGFPGAGVLFLSLPMWVPSHLTRDGLKLPLPPYLPLGNPSGCKLSPLCQTWLEQTSRFRSHEDSEQADACVYTQKRTPTCSLAWFPKKTRLKITMFGLWKAIVAIWVAFPLAVSMH